MRAAILLLVLVPAARADRLRHEYVPPEVLRLPIAAPGGSAVEGGEPLPTAMRRDGERLEAPGEADPDAPAFNPPPEAQAAGDIPRPREARPDRQTTQDDALTYHAIFNPTVAPMRRNVVFDQVEADYRLTTRPGPLRDAPRGPRAAQPGREMFWGDVRVTTGQGPAPIPSVAPDMRILAVQTEPAVEVRFSKDAADNYYVEAAHAGEVRVVFLVDADAAYFSAPLPGNVPLGAQAGQPGTALPPAIAAEARAVLDELGVRPDQPFDQGLDRLVAWFRAFEAGAPPPQVGSIYRDLALGKRGVCRHRTFAFLITARAAGVPARAVQNEAHAFAEVLAPDGHWRRVDLGGQAPSLDFKNAEDHRLHRPPPDPFSKPDVWREQYSAALTGEPGGGAEVRGTPPALGGGVRPEPTAGGAGEPDGPWSGGADGPRAEVPLPGLDGAEISLDPDAVGPADGDAGAPPVGDRVARAPAILRLDRDGGLLEAWRGEALPSPVTGTLQAEAGALLGGVKVQIYLVPEGTGGPRPVGQAVVTGPDGRFSAPVRLPPTLGLGRYRLVAASADGEAHDAARSDTQR